MIIKNALMDGEIRDIKTENGKITYIGKCEGDGIDAEGLEAVPGLVDIHAHGCIGQDTMDGDLADMAKYLAECGTLTWYPTTITESIERMKKACAAKTDTGGANIPGFHVEGPYICQKYKGAQNSKYIRNPDLDEFLQLDNVKLVTIAPELDSAEKFIENCGCTVCLGHSDATYDEAARAARAGAKCLTHTFNAMAPLHHREPSLIGAAVTEDMYVQVISDGLHLHRAAVLALYKMFSSDRMILISDSMRATGLGDGEYEFGGQLIDVIDGVARTKDGAIAGSTSTLMDCVKSAIAMGIEKSEAIKMASETPSAMMGLNKGKIAVGYDADILLCDTSLNIEKIIINGKIFK